MSRLKELWTLGRWLTGSKPAEVDVKQLEVVQMRHFPAKGYAYMYWCGRLVTRDKVEDVLYRLQHTASGRQSYTHECIHAMQAKQCRSWARYYLRYVWEWIKGNPVVHPGKSAYYTIPYEVEAYANEDKPEYVTQYDGTKLKHYTLKKRKQAYRAHRYGWRTYVKQLPEPADEAEGKEGEV